MQNILLITYLFPPSGGVGVPRAVGYARYLPQHGYRVAVLCPRRPSTAYYDPELGELVPSEVLVYRAFNPELPYGVKNSLWRNLASRKPAQHDGLGKQGLGHRVLRSARKAVQQLLFPDIQSTWVPFAVRVARHIIAKHAIDTIILNTPPYSLFKIGIALKEEYPHLRLITDLRDDWLGYYVSQKDGPSDYALGWTEREWQRARQLEQRVVDLSDFVSIATMTWRNQLCQRYPDQPQEKFICTTNGYEPALLSDVSAAPRGDRKVVVTYFGTLNASRVYSPETYLQAVDALPEEIRSSFETRFIGRVTPDCQRYFSGRDDIRVFGFLPKKEGFRLLRESDYLLLIATNPASHAGKLFEYLAIGKPIIALSPANGEIASIIAETRSGWTVDPFEVSKICDVLKLCYQGVQEMGSALEPDWAAIRRYSWPEIVARFVESTQMAPVASRRSEQ